MMNHYSFGWNLVLQYISFHIGHSIPYLVIIFYIVGVENVHALGILAERTSMVLLFHFFSRIAQSAEETTKTNQRIIQEELTKDKHRKK